MLRIFAAPAVVLALILPLAAFSCFSRHTAGPRAAAPEAPGGIRVHMSDLRRDGLRCLRCKGTGRLAGKGCPSCRGTGTMPARSSALMPQVVPDGEPTSYDR